MSKRIFQALWAAIVGVGVAVELVAVFNGAPGDTLSEQIWYILDGSWAVWGAGVVAAGVAFWHLFLQRTP